MNDQIKLAEDAIDTRVLEKIYRDIQVAGENESAASVDVQAISMVFMDHKK